jgi:hypothetical protein
MTALTLAGGDGSVTDGLHAHPPLPVRVALGLCLAWAGIALAREAHQAAFDLTHESRHIPPVAWRFGMPPVARLQRCLPAVESLVPPDSLVIFASPPGPMGAEFFRRRWAAYLAPRLNVLALDDRQAPELASYLITFGGLGGLPPGLRLELVRRLPTCGLYRILRR